MSFCLRHVGACVFVGVSVCMHVSGCVDLLMYIFVGDTWVRDIYVGAFCWWYVGAQSSDYKYELDTLNT